MTQKRRTIQLQQGVVTDLISHLANLPEREKGPDDLINLPEIFRTKEYMAEIKGALKKGYTFEELSAIFTERCGIAISSRQLRYHFTRGKNKPKKERAQSVSSPQNSVPGGEIENAVSLDLTSKSHSKTTEAWSNNNGAAVNTNSVKSGVFSIEMNPEEI